MQIKVLNDHAQPFAHCHILGSTLCNRCFNSLLLGWWESILVEMLFFQSYDWPQNMALFNSTFSTLHVIAPLLYRAQGYVMCHSTMVKYWWRDSLFNIQGLISQWLAGHSMMTAKQAGLQDGTWARQSMLTEACVYREHTLKMDCY